jgi:hypothetical protein
MVRVVILHQSRADSGACLLLPIIESQHQRAPDAGTSLFQVVGAPPRQQTAVKAARACFAFLNRDLQ